VQYNLIKDDQEQFILSLVGLPALIGEGDESITFQVGNSWRLRLDPLTVDNQFSPGEDKVKLVGRIRHIDGPHEDLSGDALDFTIEFMSRHRPTLDSDQNADSSGRLLDARLTPVRHQDHFDLYTIKGAQPAIGFDDLLGWNLVITGDHIEVSVPSTLLLLVCGFVILNVIGRNTRGP
jgi:hypothetical protein